MNLFVLKVLCYRKIVRRRSYLRVSHVYSSPRANTWRLKKFRQGQIQFGPWNYQWAGARSEWKILNFSSNGRNLRFISIFLHKVLFTYFWRDIFKVAILNFVSKKLPGETLCKFSQIFPPKVLVYTEIFFQTRF